MFEAGSGPDGCAAARARRCGLQLDGGRSGARGARRVVVPELPGHGGSSALPAPVPTLDAYADRVAGVLDAPAVVAGHSLGGLVALRLAVRHPGLVRGVVLAGSAGISSGTRRSQRALDDRVARPARQANRAAPPPGQRAPSSQAARLRVRQRRRSARRSTRGLPRRSSRARRCIRGPRGGGRPGAHGSAARPAARARARARAARRARSQVPLRTRSNTRGGSTRRCA